DRNGQAIELLLTECRRGLAEGNVAAADPPLTEAERRLPEGGGERLRPQAARYREDVTLLRELDRIDDLRWAVVEGKIYSGHESVAEWPKAFAAHGFSAEPGAVESFASTIRSSPAKE